MPTIALGINTDIIFKHRGNKSDLRITTGADLIHWSYNLISETTPTYGGEVIQVLGVNTGPITIQGTARDPQHLRYIHHWIRKYMTNAGTGDRDEAPATFEYPARGWKFKVHITDASGLEYSLEQQHAIPWSVTAEVLEDGASTIEEATMGQFNGRKLFTTGDDQDELQSSFEFDPEHQLINPDNELNMPQGGSEASQRQYEQQFRTMGDNFQRMVGAWSAGDFERWSFDSLRDPDSQFNKTSNDYWVDIFGTSSLTEATGGTSSGSVDESVDLSNPSGKGEIVLAIKQQMEAAGVPAQLGVAISIQESNLSPDARQKDGDFAVGLFQTFPTGAGGSRSHNEQLRQAFNNKDKPVTDFYTAAMQIEAASEWIKAGQPAGITQDDADSFSKMAQWAQSAQRAGVDYRTDARFRESWAKAKTELDTAKSYNAGSRQISAGGKSPPLPTPYTTTSEYGPRSGRLHAGVDLVSNQSNPPIYSVTDGKVTVSVGGCPNHRVNSCGGGWGNHVFVQDEDGTVWIYAHMSASPAAGVGDRVKAGDRLGNMGNSGHSYGAHLHLEMHPGGYKNPQDPGPTLSAILRNL